MSEYLEPKHDWVVMKKIEFENKTASGLLIPKPGDYENLRSDQNKHYTPDRDIEKNRSRDTGRYEVVAVGPGSYVDVADDLRDDVFLRKPMSCQVGDIVLVQEGAFPMTVAGETVYLCHDYLILAIIRKDSEGNETFDPQHDYIFMRKGDGTQQSKGGIHLVEASDHTGNKALPDRWVALGVGDGPWALRQEKSKIPEFARRPMAVAIGDEFAFEGAAFMVFAGGVAMGVCQNYQVAGVFKGMSA